MEPVLIYEGDSECEVLVVQIKAKESKIRVIAGYGAQECSPLAVRETYRATVEEQVARAYLAGSMVLIAEDANAKLGPDVIGGDPHPTSENGKLLLGMIERQDLCLINNSEKCKGGPITRSRVVDGIKEESCIDFVMTSHDLHKYLISATIDSSQLYTMTKYKTTKGNPSVKRSDHHSIIVKFSLSWEKKKPPREEMFKLRDEEGLLKFQEKTTNFHKFRKIMNDNDTLEETCNKWYKAVDGILHQCFKKIKISSIPPKRTLDFQIYKSLEEIKLTKELLLTADDMMKPLLKLELDEREQQAATLIGARYKNVINESMKQLHNDETFSFENAWKLKKKLFPRCSDAPFAVFDKDKNLIDDYGGILEVMKDEFRFRLRNRKINDEYEELKELKEYLCKLRLEITKKTAFRKWTMDDLHKAIKRLKTNKCRDPLGHVNELYKHLGVDGLQSLLYLMNKIKERLLIPSKLDLSNVSTIYKGKGSRQDVINLRGIFKLPILRNLLDSLVYMDEQDTISTSMGQFQVGNQRGRNIRDHTLIVHAVIQEAQETNEEIDIQFTDIKQCFDSVWLDEATNDLFNSGVRSRNLNLIYEGNKKTRMCVETHFGRSERVELNNMVMQGSVLGGTICSNQIAKLSNKMYEEGVVYMYKNKVPIPPLAMVDDIAAVNRCNSTEGLESNVKTDSFILRKKMECQVGEGKCQYVHCGADKCRSAYKVDNETISQATMYKYLGDQVSNIWDNLYTKRWEKAQGYSATCLAMSTEMSLGYQVYSIAKMLHMSIFVNGTLTNMETWPHCTEKRIEIFERVEQTFFRKVLRAHSKTPIEAIYLELGVVPLRFQLMKRRIMYLHTIMQRDDSEITKQVVLAQKESGRKGDFYSQVKQVMDDISLTFEEVVMTGKEDLKDAITKKIGELAFGFLISKAKQHSKVNEKSYKDCEGCVHYYDPRFTPDIANLLFRFRTRTYLVKNNFRNHYKNNDILCPLCHQENDDQEHLLSCVKIKEAYSENIDLTTMDIFSGDVDELYATARTLKVIDRIRTDLIEGIQE